MKNKLILLLPLLAAILFAVGPSYGQCASNDPSSPVGIVPVIVAGNPALCTGGIRIDPPVSGTYDLDAFGNTVTVTISSSSCGQVFSWSVPEHIVIDHVIAKGGPNANDYDYTGQNPRPSADGNLHSPLSSSGKYADLSHIDFCFHYRLTIGKTATPKFTRTFDWSITKACTGPNPLTLSAGQTYNYPFTWTASVSGFTDSDWKVDGTITIVNNTPYAATITSITDVLTGGVNATPSCGVTFPYVLASGATLNCTYTGNLSGATNGTNTATVVTSTPLVEGGTATADYTFGDPTSLVDECITVTDDCTTPATVCTNDAPHTNTYSCPIGPYDVCGDYTYTNTASFVTNDRGLTDSKTCVVSVSVPCVGGCTLTPGYWKTHSEFGPAPYDETWAQLSNGASTPFYLSGQTYYEVLWTTPSGGNAYYILAHAYIAAELNFLNGADPSAAQASFIAATALFNTYTPAQIAALRGNNPIRASFLSNATTLDNYNNGLIGPGHCDEESAALAKAVPTEPEADDTRVELAPVVPESYNLAQNYPNPFNPSTSITYDVPELTFVSLKVFNALGEEVANLVEGEVPAGRHQVSWNAEDMASGLYFYRIQAGSFFAVKKMVLMR